MMRRNRESGFTLLETLVVIAIIAVVAAFAIINAQTALSSARVDTAYDTVLTQLRQVHQRAIDERLIYMLTFCGASYTAPCTAANTMVIQNELAGQTTPTTLYTSTLPYDIAFQTLGTFPTSNSQTPDNFGVAGHAIDFDVDYSGGYNVLYFQPDGSVRDNLGRINNGVVYLARTGDNQSARAFTIYGMSGRIKGWRFTQSGTTWSWK